MEHAGGSWMNLGQVVTRAARLHGERVAVVDGEREVSFRDLDMRSSQFADLLAHHGVGPGDPVALLVGNRAEWFDATLGTMKSGAVRTFINPRHAASEVAFQVEDSGARIVVASEEFMPLLDQADLRSVSEIIEIDDSYEQALRKWDANRPIVNVASDDPIEIRYTSGTTGRPKGAVHTHNAWTMLSLGMIAHLGIRSDDVMLHVGPMSHASGGYGVPMIMAGGRQVIHRGFEPVEVVESIPKYGITTMLMVPTMIYLLLDLVAERGIDASTLRTVMYGAAPMSPHRLERCLEIIGPVFVQGYGMSEVLGGMTFLEKEEHIPGSPQLASCGRQSMLGELIIADDDGRELPVGEVGEILMRGPTQLKEYLNRPDATAAAITEDGWFRSGDVARIDESGFVYIVDRKSDMIVSGGFNVYPVEIENAFMEHDAVDEVVVIAVPDDKWGEAVKAVIRLRPGYTLDEASALEFVKPRLAGYKRPKSIDFTDEELPKNPTGKLLRRAVREPYWAGRDRNVG